MNYGPLIFLAAFFALAASWFQFVLAPMVQLGSLPQTNTLTGVTYPLARPGEAAQGLQVYRANGCAVCHSQQVGQRGTVFEVELTAAGTNRAAVAEVLGALQPGLGSGAAERLLDSLPRTWLRVKDKETAEGAQKRLTAAGAKAQVGIVPTGPDIARGWGKRRTVAEDFIYDDPVLPGDQRVGPDLANVGGRLPDVNWHYRHLYAPRAEVADSTMPPHRFLFERRKLGKAPSPEALRLPPAYAPEPGYEIVPRPEARALAAYLLSLRADAPLFAAPLTAPLPAPTNAASAAGASTK